MGAEQRGSSRSSGPVLINSVLIKVFRRCPPTKPNNCTDPCFPRSSAAGRAACCYSDTNPSALQWRRRLLLLASAIATCLHSAMQFTTSSTTRPPLDQIRHTQPATGDHRPVLKVDRNFAMNSPQVCVAKVEYVLVEGELRKPSSIAAHGSLSLLQDGSSFLPSFLGSLSLLSTGKLQWFLSRRPMTEGGAEPIDWLVRPMKGAQVPYRKPMPKKKKPRGNKKNIYSFRGQAARTMLLLSFGTKKAILMIIQCGMASPRK